MTSMEKRKRAKNAANEEKMIINCQQFCIVCFEDNALCLLQARISVDLARFLLSPLVSNCVCATPQKNVRGKLEQSYHKYCVGLRQKIVAKYRLLVSSLSLSETIIWKTIFCMIEFNVMNV